MRRILFVVAMTLCASQAFADRGRPRLDWVTRVPMTATALQQAVTEAAVAEAAGPRPVVLIETNYYTFLSGEPLQVRVTTDANGFSAPVSLYLYWENRRTGERRYYSAASGLLPAGTQSDLFGSASAGPVAVTMPTLNDFVLFGSASDPAGLSWGLNGALGASRVVAANDLGLFQWVFEVRDAAGRRVISRSNAMYSHIASSVTVSGSITQSTTWTADKRYILNEFVGVTQGDTLTIEPGTVIYGGSPRATLFIQRGAKIIADGTARRPIIFTSPQRTGSRAARDWGSLVLLGQAPINLGTAFLEGLPSEPAYTFGGLIPDDSSGIVRYVRLEFGGFEIQTNQEINGLTLAGVGSGTVIDHVEILHNKDDGFEFFGGTVNASHLLGVAVYDDALDFDFGYSGSVQFAAFVKRASSDESDSNSLIESDNGNPQFDNLPRTNPLVYNITAVRETRTDQGNFGAVLRRGTAGKFHNAIIANTRRAPVTVRDTSTFNAVTSGELVLNNSLLFGDFSNAAFTSSDNADGTRNFLFTTMNRNRNADPMLVIGVPTLTETFMPDLTPLAGSPALDANYVATPPDNGFLEAVDFIGAVGPGNNWILSGWANFSDN